MPAAPRTVHNGGPDGSRSGGAGMSARRLTVGQDSCRPRLIALMEGPCARRAPALVGWPSARRGWTAVHAAAEFEVLRGCAALAAQFADGAERLLAVDRRHQLVPGRQFADVDQRGRDAALSVDRALPVLIR